MGGCLPPQYASTSGHAHSNSLSATIPPTHGSGQQGRSLCHSRSSSNLGDEGERDVDWDDDESGPTPGADVFSGLGVQTTSTGKVLPSAPSPLSLIAPSPSPRGHSPSPHPSSPSEEWSRWAAAEILRGRKHVDKLVNIVRALVEVVNGKGMAMTPGREQSIGTSPVMSGKGEEDESELPVVRGLRSN